MIVLQGGLAKGKNNYFFLIKIFDILLIDFNNYFCYKIIANAPVAQLDRAVDYESEGWGFESSQARHFIKLNAGRV